MRTLTTIADACRITAGRVEIAPAVDGHAPLVVDTSTDELRDGRVRGYLYAHYYAGSPMLCEDGGGLLQRIGLRHSDPAFVEQLRVANTGAGYWSEGWVVETAAGPELRVQKGGITLTVDPDTDLRHDTSAGLGATVAVRFPKDAARGSPGFYVAHGDHGPPRPGRITRFYLSIRAQAASRITRMLVDGLRGHRRPFTFKVLADPDGYERLDAAVLYVDRSDVEDLMPAVLATYRACRAGFRGSSPGFVRPLAPGLGVADQPTAAPHHSFGEHRVSLAAEGLWHAAEDAHGASVRTGQSLLDFLTTAFREAGVDPDNPHLDSSEGPDYAPVGPEGWALDV